MRPQRSRRRLLGGLAIVVFWLVMMGLLIDRHRVTPGDWSGGRALSEPTETWLAISVGGAGSERQRVGFAHVQQLPERRDDQDGLTVRLTLQMALELLGREADLKLTGWGWKALLDSRSVFDFSVAAGGSEFRIEGETFDRQLRGSVHSGGEIVPLELSLPADLAFPDPLGSPVALPALEVGDEIELATFDPVTLSSGRSKVRCVGQEVIAIDGEEVTAKILTVETSGLTTRTWIDDRGEVLRAETPFGLSLHRVSAAEALERDPLDASSVDDLLRLTAVRPTGQTPFRGAEEMRVRLGLPDGLDPLPNDQRQRAPTREASPRAATEEQILVVATQPEPTSQVTAAERRDSLASDAFIQADHPRLIEQAQAISGDLPAGSWEQATAIHEWVFTSLEKVPLLSIPSALDVLEQRRGDCNEHAVLFTALARAAGIPTRIAIGLVWSELLHGFYYHAWPEVLVDGQWRAMDPTLGQTTADATHLKLLVGGIERWPQLLPYLGRLQIDVLEVR